MDSIYIWPLMLLIAAICLVAFGVRDIARKHKAIDDALAMDTSTPIKNAKNPSLMGLKWGMSHNEVMSVLRENSSAISDDIESISKGDVYHIEARTKDVSSKLIRAILNKDFGLFRFVIMLTDRPSTYRLRSRLERKFNSLHPDSLCDVFYQHYNDEPISHIELNPGESNSRPSIMVTSVKYLAETEYKKEKELNDIIDNLLVLMEDDDD